MLTLLKCRPAQETNKTIVGRLYWEGDRKAYLDAIDYGLQDNRHFAKGAIDELAKISRDDKQAALYHNTSARIFWRGGFKKYAERMRALQLKKIKPAIFDRIVGGSEGKFAKQAYENANPPSGAKSVFETIFR